MSEITLVKLRCKRCGHRWVARKPVVRWCPKCHTELWDVARARATVGASAN